MRFRTLPRASQAVILLNFSAMAVAAVGIRPWWRAVPWTHMALAVLACAVLFQISFELTDGKGRMSFAFAAMLGAALLWGPANGALVGFVSGLLSTIAMDALKAIRQRSSVGLPLVRGLYNGCTGSLATIAAGLVYVGGQGLGHPFDGPALPAFVDGIAATVIFFLVSTCITGAILATLKRQSIVGFWHSELLYTFPQHLAGGAGVIALLLLAEAPGWPWSAVLVAVPMVAVQYVYHRGFDAIRRRREQIASLEGFNDTVLTSLAGAIDARVRREESHLSRVQQIALEICDNLRVAPEVRLTVRYAALVHDVGKLGVPDDILRKAGPLTPEEYERMKRHVTLGVDILRPVAFPCPVVDLVLAHHERWDGSGYPRGLAGQDIPLGARILAVAEAFEAATLAVPDRAAPSVRDAFESVRSLSGTHFDPRVVEALRKATIHAAQAAEAADTQAPSAERAAHAAEQESPDAPPTSVRRAGASLPVEEEIITDGFRSESLRQMALAQDERIASYNLGKSIGNPLDLESTVDALGREAVRVVPGTTAVVALLRPDGSLSVAAASGLYSDRLTDLALPLAASTWGDALRTGSPLLNLEPDARIREALPPDGAPELLSSLVIPLACGGRPLGVLSVYHMRRNAYETQHAERLALLGEIVAESLEVGLRLRQSEQMARQDPLTDLANDRALAQRLVEMVERTNAADPFAVILVDLDNFKSVNDTLGHLEGDRVLREVAATIRSCVRPNDFLARCSGDEFVVLLEEASPDICVHVCSRIAVAVEVMAERTGLRIGGSAGYALFPADGITPRDLLEAADRRMYRDKNARKGR